MWCANCGKDIDNNSRFCPVCGYNVRGEVSSYGDDYSRCPLCNSHDVIVSKKGYNPGIVIFLIIFSFLTFGFGLILLLIFFLCGFIGANETQWICKKCGHKWNIKQIKKNK